MADTTYHHGVQTVVIGPAQGVRHAEADFTPPPEPDWITIDRLITLMAYVVLDRMLRNPPDNGAMGTGVNDMDRDIRFQIVERLQLLIELFKQPR